MELSQELRKWKNAANDVIRLLDIYDGEEVVAYEHPLHDAVRKLESVTRKTRNRSGTMPFRLPTQMQNVWFALIGYSRGPRGNPLHPISKLPQSWHPIQGLDNSQSALHCSHLLRVMLSGAVDVMEVIDILVSQDESLPVPSYFELARRKLQK